MRGRAWLTFAKPGEGIQWQSAGRQGRARFLRFDLAEPSGPEIRSPKSEIRKKAEIRRPNQNGKKLVLTAEYAEYAEREEATD